MDFNFANLAVILEKTVIVTAVIFYWFLQYVQVVTGKTFSQLPRSVFKSYIISIPLFSLKLVEEVRASPK